MLTTIYWLASQAPCVVRANRLLPDPACALDDEMSADVIADRIGPVRLTFEKRRYWIPKGEDLLCALALWAR